MSRRTSKTRKRLQKKLAARKAQHRDTHSVRRVLKRLGRKSCNRTLVEWAPQHAILVFEDLHLPQPEKGTIGGKALRRRLSLWQRALLRTCVANKAQESGMQVASVDPRYTSKNCSRCGLRGVRHRHAFSCPHCGYRQHADINAAFNIRNRYTILRDGGRSSMRPEAVSGSPDEGKPRASALG